VILTQFLKLLPVVFGLGTHQLIQIFEFKIYAPLKL
jgi:hypothetical protein